MPVQRWLDALKEIQEKVIEEIQNTEDALADNVPHGTRFTIELPI